MRAPEVGAPCLGDFFGHVAPPFGDFGVVAGLKDVGDGVVVPDGWFGVLWVFEQAV